MDGADIKFEIAVGKGDGGMATGADEFERMLEFGRRRGSREIDLPEVVLVGEEGDAVGVGVVFGSDFTDDADFSFAIGLEGAEIQLLLG